jgi:rhodanese-related sulfurtransferase
MHQTRHSEPAAPATELDVRALHEELAAAEPPLLIDVREPHEVALGAIAGAVHVPLGRIVADAAQVVAELGPQLGDRRPVVTYCHHGMRSLRAAQQLQAAGVAEVRSLRGGIDAWAVQIDPSVGRY